MASVNTLVVAGGGQGGNTGTSSLAGGGGGAGGYLADTALTVTVQAYTITVGAGGTGSSPYTVGGSGADSVFSTLTAVGGGGGGCWNLNPATTGGSGGGGGEHGTSGEQAGAVGTSGQGYAGGSGMYPYNASAGTSSGGGGGGAGAVGANMVSTTVGGAGGVGVANSISGSSVYYAGGGGAGAGTTAGAGGNGGGGAGGNDSAGTAGTANTGGGGGGGENNASTKLGGAGGSGIVIISYATDGSDGVGTASTGGIITTSGDQTIHTFTSDGTFTVSTASAFTPQVNADGAWHYDTYGTRLSTGDTEYLIGKPNPYVSDSAYRFPSVSIPQGATILTCYLKDLTATRTKTLTNSDMNISCEDADDTSVFVTDVSTPFPDWVDRPRTTASTKWSVPNTTTASLYDSDDFTSSLQEVIDRGGWTSGNAVVVFLETDAAFTSNTYTGFKGSGTGEPTLVVTYEAGGASTNSNFLAFM